MVAELCGKQPSGNNDRGIPATGSWTGRRAHDVAWTATDPSCAHVLRLAACG